MALIVATAARAGQRMARVGQPARVGTVGERLGDGVGDRHAAQRHVAGVHALGEGDQVGRDVPWSTANHSPQRPKPAITSSAMNTMP